MHFKNHYTKPSVSSEIGSDSVKNQKPSHETPNATKGHRHSTSRSRTQQKRQRQTHLYSARFNMRDLQQRSEVIRFLYKKSGPYSVHMHACIGKNWEPVELQKKLMKQQVGRWHDMILETCVICNIYLPEKQTKKTTLVRVDNLVWNLNWNHTLLKEKN